MRFEITGDLATIVARRLLNDKPFLFYNKFARPLTRANLTLWFHNLRQSLIAQYPDLSEDLMRFQFRDLRAKSATDIFLSSTLTDAKEQLGHTSENMTRTYVRKAKPRQPIATTPVHLKK